MKDEVRNIIHGRSLFSRFDSIFKEKIKIVTVLTVYSVKIVMENSKHRWLKPDHGRSSLHNPSSRVDDANLVTHRQCQVYNCRAAHG